MGRRSYIVLFVKREGAEGARLYTSKCRGKQGAEEGQDIHVLEEDFLETALYKSNYGRVFTPNVNKAVYQ